jgi:glutamate---cysteine ligase / carboxylate-amine ligase
MSNESERRPLSLFEGYGIEIECPLVDATSFDVLPVADDLLRRAAAAANGVAVDQQEWIGDVEDGPIEWSNELVNHVLEFKTAGPVPHLDGIAAAFRASQGRADRIARELGARLVPGAMHPWMRPSDETVLWRHENSEIYDTYDRLFDCKRHGWANLQSVHLNLPFADDDEFGRLLAAVRVVLPLVPALAAASPWIEGRATGLLDNRLEVYRTNSAKVGAMTGAVIPEQVFDRAGYRTAVFDPIDAQLTALGVGEPFIGVEWTNARGAIARFDRMAVEIRLIDSQEHAGADLAVCAAVTELVRGLVDERWSSGARQRAFSAGPLLALLIDATARGRDARLPGPEYAALFGFESDAPSTCGELFARLVPQVFRGPVELEEPLRVLLEHGTLAERMLAALGSTERPERAALRDQLEALAECLLEGRPYLP